MINVWGSWCPPCRAEAPNLAAAAEELAADDVVFVGVNTKDASPEQGAGLPAPLRRALPVALRPGRSQPARLPRHAEPSAIPSTVVIDAQGRVAASILGEMPSRPDPGRPGRGRPASDPLVVPLSLGGWFQDTALNGSLVLAIPVALVAGLVSFFSPVRGAAAAGLPLLRHRPVRRRPRRRQARPDADRLAAVRARLLLRLRLLRRAVRRRRGVAVRLPAADHDRAGVADDPARHRLPGRGARGCSATSGSTRSRPSGWPPRRCSACSSASAGRRASARR